MSRMDYRRCRWADKRRAVHDEAATKFASTPKRAREAIKPKPKPAFLTPDEVKARLLARKGAVIGPLPDPAS